MGSGLNDHLDPNCFNIVKAKGFFVAEMAICFLRPLVYEIYAPDRILKKGYP